MKSRFLGVLVLAASGWLAAAVATPGTLVLTPVPETEPNNTPATADPLVLADGCEAATGAISPGNDFDYYSFTAAPGAKVWALVDTGPSTTGRDSILTLFAPDGTTILETDDDDAPGNDCDATIESFQASAIAGRTLTAGGTYFLRVESFNSVAMSAYKLFVVVTSSSTAESEPNNTAATADTLVTAGSPIGVRTGAIGTVGDADYYSLTLTAPATFFISADGDPERNGGTDLVVDLIGTNGTTVLFSDDNTDEIGSGPPPAESFCFTIAAPGTYFVRVTGFSQGKFPVTGTYAVMAAACGLPAGATPTPTPTATIGTPGPTATPTATRTPTIQGGGGVPPNGIPTLSFPMLVLMGLGLIATAFVLVRRL
jgi:pre-peptidase